MSTDEDWTVSRPLGAKELFFLHGRPKAETKAEYLEQLLKHVTVKYEIRVLGSAMIDLNRRFSHLSKRFGLSVRDALIMLLERKDIAAVPHRGNLILLPYAAYNALLSDPDTAVDSVQRLCDETLRDIGKLIPDKRKK